MNFSRRVVALLLCFLLFSCVFSVSASAETVDVPDSYQIRQMAWLWCGSGISSQRLIDSQVFYVNDGETSPRETTVSNYKASDVDKRGEYSNEYYLTYNDESIILEEGKQYNVKLSNMYYSLLIRGNGYSNYYRTASIDWIVLESFDEERMGIDESSYHIEDNHGSVTVSFDCVPEFDVKTIIICVDTDFTGAFSGYTEDYNLDMTVYTGEYDGDDKYNFLLEVQSEEAGLLEGVIEWLKSIKDGITNLGQGIANIFKSITELPSKIWQYISDGLKSLFIPDDAYIVAYKEDMEELLESKFGAVAQVVNITLNSWDNISASDESNTIEFPEVTIPLPENNEFSFGGQTVPIVPEGFDFLETIIKTVVGGVCTLLFINGLKRRYDELFGGH